MVNAKVLKGICASFVAVTAIGLTSTAEARGSHVSINVGVPIMAAPYPVAPVAPVVPAYGYVPPPGVAIYYDGGPGWDPGPGPRGPHGGPGPRGGGPRGGGPGGHGGPGGGRGGPGGGGHGGPGGGGRR